MDHTDALSKKKRKEQKKRKEKARREGRGIKGELLIGGAPSSRVSWRPGHAV